MRRLIIRKPIKISIITVSYNSLETIETTLRSVMSQSYSNIEHIVVDGGSTDGTINMIKCYEDQIAYFLSEPDCGIYDAMNKGIRLATGDVIGFLNSDDFYAYNHVLNDVADVFKNHDVDCCYGDLDYVDPKNVDKIVRKWRSSPHQLGLFRTGWHPPHPTFFVKRQVYQQYGLFDLDLDISADYEIMLRFLDKYALKSYYISRVLVKMRNGGASNKNIKQIIKANLQCWQAWKKNGYPICLRASIMKPLSKIPQMFRGCFCRFYENRNL